MNLPSKLILPKGYKNNNDNIIRCVSADMMQWRFVKPHYLFTGRVGSGKTYLKEIIFDSIKKMLTAALELSQKSERCFDFKNTGKMKGNTVLASNEYYLQGLIDCMKTYSARDIYKHYLANNFEVLPVSRIFCLDDIGAEKETAGSRDLIIEMITTIYDRFRVGKNLVVIITTNLDGKAIINRYGSRTEDRIEEMCQPIMEFNNHSFRRDKAEVIKREK